MSVVDCSPNAAPTNGKRHSRLKTVMKHPVAPVMTPTDHLPSERRPAAKPRHVLYLFDQLRSLNGGAERSLLRLTQLLPANRYRASVATFWQPAEMDFLREFSCPVHILPLENTYGLRSLKVARRLREIIRSEDVSVVQTFFPTSDLWGGILGSACESHRRTPLGHHRRFHFRGR